MRIARWTFSRSKPISIMLEIDDSSASPDTASQLRHSHAYAQNEPDAPTADAPAAASCAPALSPDGALSVFTSVAGASFALSSFFGSLSAGVSFVCFADFGWA